MDWAVLFTDHWAGWATSSLWPSPPLGMVNQPPLVVASNLFTPLEEASRVQPGSVHPHPEVAPTPPVTPRHAPRPGGLPGTWVYCLFFSPAQVWRCPRWLRVCHVLLSILRCRWGRSRHGLALGTASARGPSEGQPLFRHRHHALPGGPASAADPRPGS